jgi:TPP-dependent 2-oxoacid decarboxylase
MQAVVRKLVESCGIRFFTTPMGKALLDEHHPLYGGCYAGANSLEAVRKEVESSDFALYVGALKSDFNSGSFSVGIDPKVVVELHSFTTTVGVCHPFLPAFGVALTSSTHSTQRQISDTSSLFSSPPLRKQTLNHRARH